MASFRQANASQQWHPAASVLSQQKALQEWIADQGKGTSLYVAANRPPYAPDVNGDLKQGLGGLASAFASLARVIPMRWFGTRSGQVGGLPTSQHPPGSEKLVVDWVDPSPYQQWGHYDQIANGVLWMLQHRVCAPSALGFDEKRWRAWQDGYVAVNRLYAERIGRQLARHDHDAVIFVQDYHLYLLPTLLRAQGMARARIAHFTHICWPEPEQWIPLPTRVRRDILAGLLGADLLGFQVEQDRTNFLKACARFMGCEVSQSGNAVCHEGRWVKVGVYPISIDPVDVLNRARSGKVCVHTAPMMTRARQRWILQVARTDPSKNIVRGLEAFEHLLKMHPEWHGKITWLGLLPLSRQAGAIYRSYYQRIQRLADRLNQQHARPGWTPVSILTDHDPGRALALMRAYDVLLVNSVADGMNLVAKEGPIVNTQAGVLVLSETVGACQELGHTALLVNPYDVIETARALDEALRMPIGKRRQALRQQQQLISENTIYAWALAQLRDLSQPPPSPTSGRNQRVKPIQRGRAWRVGA